MGTVPDTFNGQASKQIVARKTRASFLAVAFSRADEDVVEGGRSMVLAHVTVHERQHAVEAVDTAALAQYVAVRRVEDQRATLHVHRAIEGIDPPAQGSCPVRLITEDLAVGQR